MSPYEGEYILAIDQGTSGTDAVLFNQQGHIVETMDVPVNSYYPSGGRVEQHPFELLESIRQAFHGLIAKTGIRPGQILAMGLSNQGESCLFWDRETGEPLSDVIVWQDIRGEELCQRLVDDGVEPDFKKRTGLPISAEWPATKISWALAQDGKLKMTISQGRAVLSPLDTWFIYQLSNHSVCVTDASTASRTGLYNIHTMNWDQSLLDLFDARKIILPSVVDSSGEIAMVNMGEGWSFPLTGNALDQSAALLGQACTLPGEMKVTYGTCVGFWYDLGQNPVEVSNMATSIAWQIGRKPTYALAGEVGTAGAALGWLHSQLKAGWSNEKISEITNTASPQEDLLFLPAFKGLDAPHWVMEARGTLYGINGGTGLEQILFAVLQSIGFTTSDILENLAEAAGIDLPPRIVVDGGIANNAYLMQFQSDLLGRPVVVPANLEGSSTGVAYLAGAAIGYYSSIEEVRQAWQVGTIYQPKIGDVERKRLRLRWQNVLDHSIKYYRDPRLTGRD